MMQIPTCIIKPLPTMVAYNGAYWQLVTAASVRLWQVYLEYLQSFWVWDKYVDTASLNDSNSYLYNKAITILFEIRSYPGGGVRQCQPPGYGIFVWLVKTYTWSNFWYVFKVFSSSSPKNIPKKHPGYGLGLKSNLSIRFCKMVHTLCAHNDIVLRWYLFSWSKANDPAEGRI